MLNLKYYVSNKLGCVSLNKQLMRFTVDVKTECTNLSVPANGRIELCSSGRAGVGFEGDTCNFTCNTGYELTGGDTRTCQSDGSWSGSDDVCSKGNLNKYIISH